VIDDFKFLHTHGRKAFVGQLLTKLDGALRVDAETVVPLGLSARAAAAQARASGHAAKPASSDRAVITQRDLDSLFIPDLQAAENRIVIYSPFITHNRLAEVGPQLRAAVERDVPVYVVTKTLNDRNKTDEPGYRELMRTLQRRGVTVIPKKAMHEKLVFIDYDIV
jgi:PLD-like domain